MKAPSLENRTSLMYKYSQSRSASRSADIPLFKLGFTVLHEFSTYVGTHIIVRLLNIIILRFILTSEDKCTLDDTVVHPQPVPPAKKRKASNPPRRSPSPIK
ncbi:hypothetical protein J6590_084021 [Homalodisca vitripennis]|nr:hypothetical protein J6590_084021 [Homalodisca vitripennis]